MYSFDSILNRMLMTIPDTFDKRQGSIIYDAIAPAAAEFAQAYINMEIQKDQTYVKSATDINLDNRGADFSIGRFQATSALRIARMYNQQGQLFDINIGDRFAIPSEAGGLIFVAVERVSQGEFILQAEFAGSIGNEYFGDILPLFINNRLGRAEIIGTQVPARDIETDDEYRKRIIERLSAKSFGGNIADYKEFTRKISGVGNLKVFPVWDGGGSVKLSVIDGSFDTITPEFATEIKNIIDPTQYEGKGVGIAPIGHVVTVSTPNRFTINIEATVTLDNVTIGQIQTIAEQNIKDYFLSIRKSWADNQIINVFNIMVANAILNITGVINVTGVKLNGIAGDLVLRNTEFIQELPYIGTVVLRA